MDYEIPIEFLTTDEHGLHTRVKTAEPNHELTQAIYQQRFYPQITRP
jgi:hypothetical protein